MANGFWKWLESLWPKLEAVLLSLGIVTVVDAKSKQKVAENALQESKIVQQDREDVRDLSDLELDERMRVTAAKISKRKRK